MLSKTLTGALGAGIFALGAATSAHAATITVNDTGDSGGGTLRSAINAANNTAVKDTIKFSFAGSSVRTITPTSPLPVISEPVKINGYTHNAADPASDTAAAKIKIVIDASNMPRGLDVGSDGVEIRGLDIQNAQDTGIYVDGDDAVVAGNHIGTAVGGSVARPNGAYGVQVFGSRNLVGGPDAADRNVISSNPITEVAVGSGTDNLVQGNRIGTDADGTAKLVGGLVGVGLESDGNEVRDNLISGELFGVHVTSDANTIQHNNLGTDRDGTAALGNLVGVAVFAGDRNLIGGDAEGEGNLISGNNGNGVELAVSGGDPAEDNDVQGNLIGTTAAGDAALANGSTAVWVTGSSDNTIGGAAAGAGNVIAGNDGDGVAITFAGADDNRVLGNWIGTDKTGALDLGNSGSGVEIDGGLDNRVGDTTGTFAPNTIARNGDDGVTVTSGTGNAILRNSIHDNDELAVDLGANGSTANDDANDDADVGANDLQNGPEIDTATATDVGWALHSVPNTTYRLEFYANDTCSVSHNTEAQTYLGTINATTDANGDADDDSTPITLPAGAGSFVSMTATRLTLVAGGGFPPLFTLQPRSTSEVSPCEEIA